MNKDMARMQFQLKQFDMSQITDDKVIVMIGKRGTGKSSLVKDLLYHHQDIPVSCVISATEQANKFYHDFIPSIFIHDEYEPPIIHHVVQRQQKTIKKIQKEEEYLGVGKSKIDPRIAVILDDCLYDSSWTRDKYVRNIFMNGRHFKILFLITMQYPLGIPPNLRCNIDYIFILRENIVGNRKRIYDNYAGMFPTLDVFNQVMDQTTEDYGCLVINNTSKSNRLEDQVFWYKANLDKSNSGFKMCKQDFWNISSTYEQEKEQKKQRDQDKELQELTSKKSTVKINVRKEH